MTRIILLLTLLLAACGPVATAARSQALAPDANDIALDPAVAYRNLVISRSGSATDPITVYGNGATVQCLSVTGSHVTVQGVLAQGCASHGIVVSGQYITLTGNTVRGNVTSNGAAQCTGSGQWGSAVKVYLGGQHITISDNVITGNCGEGIAITRGVDVTVTRNRVTDAFSVGIYVDNSNGVRVTDNTVQCVDPNYYRSGQPARGLLLGAESYSGWGFQLRDVDLAANRVEGCLGLRYYSQVSGTPTAVTVRDNLFVGVPVPAVSLPAWAVISGNIIASPTPGTPVSGTPSRTPPAPTRTPATVPPTPSATPECYTLPTSRGRVSICFE